MAQTHRHPPLQTVACPVCHEEIAARHVARARHLADLRDRLHGWSARGLLSREALAATLADVTAEHDALHGRTTTVDMASAATAGNLPAHDRDNGISSSPGPAATLWPVTGATPPALPRGDAGVPPALSEDALLAPSPAPSPAPSGATSPERRSQERRPQPAPDTTATTRLARSHGGAPTARIELGPASARQPLTWRRVGLALLSERTLNTLLLVGALLILASASVISTLNPTRLAPLPHLGALVATTAVFALAGLALRGRFALPRAAGALLAISGVFLPLDVWALGERELLAWSRDVVWLVASALCLCAYLLAHLLLRNRTFALLTTAAGVSLALVGAVQFGIPIDWWACLLVMLGIVYEGLGRTARARLPLLAGALRGGGHTLALAALAVTTLGAAAASFGLALIAPSGPALAAVWWLGALYYAVHARAAAPARYAAVAASAGAVAALLMLESLPLLGPWTPVAVASLACLYGGYGYARTRRAPPAPLWEAWRQWPYSIAAALSAAALVWPEAVPAARCSAAALLAILYAWGTRRVRGPVPAIVAVALLPVILANAVAALGLPDPLLVWAGCALCLATAAEYAVRRRDHSHEDARLSSWTAPFVLPLFALGYVTGAATLVASLLRYPEVWGAQGLPTFAAPVIPSLLLLTAGLLGAGLAQRRPLFFHLAVWLAVLPYTPVAVALGERLGWIGHDALRGEVWALLVLGLAYFLVSIALDRAGRRGAHTLYPPAYMLPSLATAAAVLAGAGSVTGAGIFGLTLAMYAWSIVSPPRGHAAARSIFGYLCAWLFPLWLLDAPLLWGWIPDAGGGLFGVELTLLAPVYLCGAAYLCRRAPEQAPPWVFAGATLTVCGPLLTAHHPPVCLAATVVSLVTYCGAALVSRRPAWAWGIALALPFLASEFYASLDPALSAIPVFSPDACYLLIGLPIALVLLGAGDLPRARGARRAWTRPFDVVACGLLVLLVMWAAIFLLFDGDQNPTVVGATLVYLPVLAAYASRLRRRAPAWFAIGFGFIAAQGGLALYNIPILYSIPIEARPVCWAVVGLALTALLPRAPLLWQRPLGWTAAALAVLSSTVATLYTGTGANHAAEQACMLTFAVVGLQFVTWGVGRRERMPIYGGVAIVGLAYQGQLLISGIAQPQLFVLPAGAYLLAVAYAEWLVAPRRPVKKVLEWSALILTVGTSLPQALGVWADGAPSSVYDLLVIGEGLALLWLGNRLYWKDTLTVGAAALCIDAALIVKEPLRAVDTWYVVAVAGLAIIGFVIAVEKKRQDLAVLVGQWRRLRETWD